MTRKKCKFKLPKSCGKPLSPARRIEGLKKMINRQRTVYEEKDLVLADMMGMKEPCVVTVTIDEHWVTVQVGPRDISWERHTKKWVNSGCWMGKPCNRRKKP